MPRRRAAVILSLVALVIGPDPTSAQPQRPPVAPANLFDPRLDDLRKASLIWDERTSKNRVVIDQVCLVPDLPTFLEAIATWDDQSYFPILIEDVPSTLRFLRAFRPARIVRFPKKSEPIAVADRWAAALAAVKQSGERTEPPAGAAKGEAKPFVPVRGPGVVISAPESPSLAGAVALAAGRFQPLARFDYPKKFNDTLDTQGLNEFALGVENAVESVARSHRELGDDCDFITLAGDWPYRYNAKDGPRCLDDLVGRSPSTLERWAFAGRLLADEKASVYQAMCSLFLASDSAALFNAYPENGTPWSDYKMNQAATKLTGLLPVDHVSGEREATLTGWHKLFDPRNRHGLVMINSKGGPTQFDMFGRGATTLDVPQTVPAAVVMIHSFSAAEPQNPGTIAGRWLANGAFIYHGSTHEPYLQSFRPPTLTANLIAEGIPLGAALRASKAEAFGQPWKLIYMGDPLYRLQTRARIAPRSDDTFVSKDWPQYKPLPLPAADADGPTRLSWAVRASIERTSREGSQRPLAELAGVLALIDRDQLDPRLRVIHDELLADILFLGGFYPELRTRIAQIPSVDRPHSAQFLVESSVVVELNRLHEAGFDKALALWEEVFRLDLGMPVRVYATAYVGNLADTPARRLSFRSELNKALSKVQRTETEALIKRTLEQIEKTLSDTPKRAIPGRAESRPPR